jgi:hypothetical protein
MITSRTTFDMPTLLQTEPELAYILSELGQNISSFCLLSGADLPSIISEEDHHLPVIVVASLRITDEWLDTIGGAELTLDGCDAGFHSRPYLAWTGEGFTLAISMYDIQDEVDEHSGTRQAVVLWMADTKVMLDWFDTDKHFQDLFYVASRSRHLLRFVPDEAYVAQKKSSYPPPLSEDEEILIGSEGEPMYVAQPVDVYM